MLQADMLLFSTKHFATMVQIKLAIIRNELKVV